MDGWIETERHGKVDVGKSRQQFLLSSEELGFLLREDFGDYLFVPEVDTIEAE